MLYLTVDSYVCEYLYVFIAFVHVCYICTCLCVICIRVGNIDTYLLYLYEFLCNPYTSS